MWITEQKDPSKDEFASYADMPANVKKEVIKIYYQNRDIFVLIVWAELMKMRVNIKLQLNIVSHRQRHLKKNVWIIEIWSLSVGETVMLIQMKIKAVMSKV